MSVPITLNNVANLQSTTTAQNTINSNNTAIVTAFGSTLNVAGDQMLGSLDMNSHQILNLPAPATQNSPARLVDVSGIASTAIPSTIASNNVWTGTNTFNNTVSVSGTATFTGAVTASTATFTGGITTGGTSTISSATLTNASMSGTTIISSGATLVAPTMSNPISTGGTATNLVLVTPTIGSITLTNVTITNPTISAGTAVSTAFTNATMLSSAMSNTTMLGNNTIGGTTTITSATLVNPGITSPTFTGSVSIPGITSGVTVGAGFIGEYKSNSSSGIGLTSATPATITSLVLTPGEWDLYGVIGVIATSGASVTNMVSTLSLTANTTGNLVETGTSLAMGITQNATGTTQVAMPQVRGAFSTATTVYLNLSAVFNSSVTGQAVLKARRAG